MGATPLVDPGAQTVKSRPLFLSKGRTDRQSMSLVKDSSCGWLVCPPGLIDIHAHLISTLAGSATLTDDRLARGEEILRQALEAGVTTVRDVGGVLELVLGLRELQRVGSLTGVDCLSPALFSLPLMVIVFISDMVLQ